jgi:hypothetical protein
MGLIGNKPNQTPTNADLGTMAYEDADYFRGNTEIDTLGTVTTGDIKNSALARSGRATIRPSLLLDFANSKTLDPRITFTRGGIGTYTDANGLVKSAASNEARFDHNPITGESLGLLIEEQRTNLLTYSENFDNAIWTKGNSTIIPNTAIAPDGTLTADKHVENTVSSTHYLAINLSGLTATSYYTYSFYAKAGERTRLTLGSWDGTLGTDCVFNLLTGVVDVAGTLGTASITNVGNGWYRCSVARAIASTILQIFPYLDSATSGAGANNYTGNGASGLYLWGAQLEEGAFATSYIPSADSFTSRASTGTFIGSNGLIQSAATNVARYNYNPLNLALSPKLLLEPAATNLLTYSEQFDNAVWVKGNSTITANAITAPDGTLTADKHVEDTNSGAHYIVYPFNAVSGNTYIASFYMKGGEKAEAIIGFDISFGFSGYQYGKYNFTTKAVAAYLGSPTVSMISVGNGWYRCFVTATATGTGNAQISVQLFNGTTNVYTGDGTSGIYLWGAQLEVGTTATSYIPTTSAQVTRSADVSSSSAATRPADNAVITGTNFSSWYRQDEGTIFAKANTTSELNSAKSVIGFDDTTALNRLYLSKKYDLNSIFELGIYANNIGQTFLLQLVTVELLNSFSFSYKVNDIAFVANSSSVSTDTSAIIPNVNRLVIGNLVGGSPLSGHIAKIAYYPKRLSNTELQGLTTT